MNESIQIESANRHAETILDLLVDAGPLTRDEACMKLGWSPGRFTAAVAYARQKLCAPLGVSIPSPTPADGWRYQVTTEWEPVEAGAAYQLGQVESRLTGIHRDVLIVMPHLTKGSTAWRRARFLDKHLSHIVSTLGEINGDTND